MAIWSATISVGFCVFAAFLHENMHVADETTRRDYLHTVDVAKRILQRLDKETEFVEQRRLLAMLEALSREIHQALAIFGAPHSPPAGDWPPKP